MTPARRPAASRDSAYMRRALSLARRGWGQTAPNPMVGAVVVRDDEVVGEGWHARFGEAHAEVAALHAAGTRARGATVYTTLEPCAGTGKTPPCVDALVAAGVSRVVAAARDPNPAMRGGGDRLQAAGIVFEAGLEAQEARELNAPFFNGFVARRPWVTLKLATSIDGAIADTSGIQGWLTGEKARREVHRLRAGSDAIAVGIGTALADDPLLTVRAVQAPRVAPLRVVFDRTARLPLDRRLVASALETPVLVVAECPDASRVGALKAAGVDILLVPSLHIALEALFERGVRSLLVEGGAGLAGALLGHGLVDRLIILQAPVVLGAGALNAFAHAPSGLATDVPRLPVVERRAIGEDLMTVYALRAI